MIATALLLLLAILPAAGQTTRSSRMTDDEFIDSLGSEDSAAVDRRRLAKILFSLASALAGDRTSVHLLLGNDQDPSRRSTRNLVDARFARYSQTLGEFKDSVSDLLDEPDSRLLLHAAITEGQRACWQLAVHNMLVESYGGDLRTVLSSREACSRFRTTVLQPRVEAIIRDALVEHIFQKEEIRALRRELRDLEELLADIRKIDEGPIPTE